MGGIGKAIGGAVGGLFGKGGSSQRSSADQLQQEGFDAIKNVDVPTLESLRISPEDLQYYKQTGKLTPALENAVAQNPSLMQSIQNNPDLVEAQMAALKKIQTVGNEGGLTIQDKAKLFEANNAADQGRKSNREAILQRFRDRGMGGSNAELMGQLSGQSADANAAAATGFNVGAEANKRALDAVTQSGQLAGQLRDQGFSEEAAKAKAQDAINQFNTQNQRDVEMRNKAQILGTNAANLENEQQINNQNVDLKNNLTKYNKDLIGENYNREMDKANALAGAAGKYSAYQTGRAAQEDSAAVNKGAGIGGLIGTGASLVGGIFSDEKLKKNVKPAGASFDKLLEHIKGKDFEYKDESMGEGKRVGVMAQDLEKSTEGKKIVKDTPEGKIIDAGNAVGAILGSQARLHERLKKLEKSKK